MAHPRVRSAAGADGTRLLVEEACRTRDRAGFARGFSPADFPAPCARGRAVAFHEFLEAFQIALHARRGQPKRAADFLRGALRLEMNDEPHAGAILAELLEV